MNYRFALKPPKEIEETTVDERIYGSKIRYSFLSLSSSSLLILFRRNRFFFSILRRKRGRKKEERKEGKEAIVVGVSTDAMMHRSDK